MLNLNFTIVISTGSTLPAEFKRKVLQAIDDVILTCLKDQHTHAYTETQHKHTVYIHQTIRKRKKKPSTSSLRIQQEYG